LCHALNFCAKRHIRFVSFIKKSKLVSRITQNVGIFDALTVACIGAGAIIMFLAVLKTSKLRKLVHSVSRKRWIWLERFMVIFLVGYIVSIGLILFGYDEPLLLIIGLVFLLGSCFVYLVVFSAKTDMQRINDSHTLLEVKNEELKKINLELDQFAYRTSHDLKAPITSLKGLIHIASLSDSQEEVTEIHRMMKERLTSLEYLIRDILDLSKNSRTDVQDVATNIYEVIQQLVSNYTHHGNSDKVQMTITGNAGLTVNIDRTRFKMVLSNLLSNSKQHADLNKQSPYVKIDYWHENDSLFVSVKDNGKGIAKEYLQRIFEMFFRAEENSRGSGLGLYIVKETTEKMGGTIDVISEKGVGSEFIVSFPTVASKL
jgi:signal transduction histidine kinase